MKSTLTKIGIKELKEIANYFYKRGGKFMLNKIEYRLVKETFQDDFESHFEKFLTMNGFKK